MSSLNQCMFIGNVGADPEIKTLTNGNVVANFSLAVTEKWKDKQSGETREHTEWVRISTFSEGLVRIIETYVRKGSKLFISGKFKTRKWQDQDGNDRYATDIVLQGFDAKLIMLGRPKGGDQSQSDNQQSDPYDSGPDIDDEVPF